MAAYYPCARAGTPHRLHIADRGAGRSSDMPGRRLRRHRRTAGSAALLGTFPIQEALSMILRIDRWQTELPPPADPDPDGASVVQELMGGKFGEMSTLMNYTFQSFNFRN